MANAVERFALFPFGLTYGRIKRLKPIDPMAHREAERRPLALRQLGLVEQTSTAQKVRHTGTDPMRVVTAG